MKKYNVVIIGAGKIGAFFDKPQDKNILTHANAFYKNEHFCFMGFFDVDLEKAKEAAKRWQVKAYSSIEEALQEAEVVSCTVSDAYHYKVLEQIAEFPIKFVFTEKPLTKTIEEAKRITELYQKKQIPIQVNYTRRFVSEFQDIKRKIKQYGTFIRGTGYYGKGVLHNGSHMLDFITFLLGNIEKAIGKKKIKDFEENDPSVEVELKVSNGVIQLFPIDCRVVTIFELELFFEKARIRFLEGGLTVELYEVKESDVFSGYYNYRKVDIINVNYGNAFENALNNIYNVLEEKECITCPVEEAKNVLELCYLLQQE